MTEYNNHIDFDFNNDDKEAIEGCSMGIDFPKPNSNIGEIIFKKGDNFKQDKLELIDYKKLKIKKNKRMLFGILMGVIVGILIPYSLLEIDSNEITIYIIWQIFSILFFGLIFRNSASKKWSFYYIGKKGISYIKLTNSIENEREEQTILFENIENIELTEVKVSQGFSTRELHIKYAIKDKNGQVINISYDKKAMLGDTCNYLLCKYFIKQYMLYIN